MSLEQGNIATEVVEVVEGAYERAVKTWMMFAHCD